MQQNRVLCQQHGYSIALIPNNKGLLRRQCMDSSLIVFNILNPPVLFFFLGMLAVFLKSDLEIPAPLPKLFSLYLLLAIGFKGGYELQHNGFNTQVGITLAAAVIMAAVVPLYSFFVLRLKLDVFNAAAIAATYGSISAVTFITAGSFLDKLGIEFGGHMVAALALMESPAIIVGLILVRVFARRGEGHESEDVPWSEVLRESFLNGSVFLLIGSLLVGLLSGDKGWDKMRPFTEEIFYGALTFFLLDMGIVAARRIRDLQRSGLFLTAFSVLMPLFNAFVGALLAKLLGFSLGNGLLFTVLCASASYIAVPAAMRMTVPEANPSIYVSMALALTFPFNIILGIPIYLQALKLLGLQ